MATGASAALNAAGTRLLHGLAAAGTGGGARWGGGDGGSVNAPRACWRAARLTAAAAATGLGDGRWAEARAWAKASLAMRRGRWGLVWSSAVRIAHTHSGTAGGQVSFCLVRLRHLCPCEHRRA